MVTKDKTRKTVKAVETSCAIIELIDELGTAGVSEVANHVSIAKSTACLHLRTLEENGYLVLDDDGRYQLGLKYLKFGCRAREKSEIHQVAQPVIDHLAEKTGEAIWVAIKEHGQAVYANKALGERAIPPRKRIGEASELHSTAVGMAILAHCSSDYIDQIIERCRLPTSVEDTLTREALLDDLKQVRSTGVAFTENDTLEGLYCVAAPVIPKDEVKGAIEIVGTENPKKGGYFRQSRADLIRESANEIELRLTNG